MSPFSFIGHKRGLGPPCLVGCFMNRPRHKCCRINNSEPFSATCSEKQGGYIFRNCFLHVECPLAVFLFFFPLSYSISGGYSLAGWFTTSITHKISQGFTRCESMIGADFYFLLTEARYSTRLRNHSFTSSFATKGKIKEFPESGFYFQTGLPRFEA